MDWLLARQSQVEDRLARRHLAGGELVLYDASSSYFEGRTCPLARRGYSRDGKRGTLQIIYGLLCDRAGRPAAEFFSGEIHDSRALGSQIQKRKSGRLRRSRARRAERREIAQSRENPHKPVR